MLIFILLGEKIPYVFVLIFPGLAFHTFVSMDTISVSKIKYKETLRIKLDFKYNSELIGITKTIPGARWSASMKCWLIPENSNVIPELLKAFKDKAWINYSELKNGSIVKSKGTKKETKPTLTELPEETKNNLEKFKYWLRSKRYGESTIATYADALKTFLKFCNRKPVQEINNDDIIQFNNEFIFKHGLSASYQNQVVNAVKLFFRTVQNKTINIDLVHRPKRPKLLPNVLSKEEIKKILESPKNIKHKAMLSLVYSCGLRRSELLNLKIKEIDSKRKLLIIKQSKGKKDRIVPLSDKVILTLREYYKIFKPKIWLFEGQFGGKYSEKSLDNVLKQSTQKAKITKPVSLHWLRHSYATHLLENGTDLRYIQEILGHNSSKTTEIYTHVSTKSLQNIKSPFDDLGL